MLPLGLHFVIVLSLLVVLAASSCVYIVLVRRATAERRWLELRDWASAHEFATRPAASAEVPPVIAERLPTCRGVAELWNKMYSLCRFESVSFDTAGIRQARQWNVLVRKLPAAWPPTGLRPAKRESSLLDYFRLASFPTFASERFVVHGDDIVAARILANSSLRALTPADVGLLLHGQSMLLDFSARPFDPIELHRVLALAEQLATRLPAPRSVASA